jgi:hypothetical protein
MKREEIKKLIEKSLSNDQASEESWKKLEEAGVSYNFSNGFREKVMERLFTAGVVVNREVEFLRSWNNAFFRIALTGVAAIVILLISLYIVEGSFSLNSILGLSDSYDESIVCLLTGN